MGLFDSKDKTSTSTNQMFPALEAGWNRALGSAAQTFKNAKAPTLAPLNDWSTQALNQTATLANQGVPNLDQLYATQSGILGNGGYTQQMTDAAGYLTNFANGSYQEDPRLQQQLNINADRAANAGATRFGGGRYGSAAIGAGIGNAVADANNGIMLQSNENARNRQLQASGQLGSLASQGANNMATWGSMTPMLNEARHDGVSRLAGIGDFVQGRRQTQADLRSTAPWQPVQTYAGILSGMGNRGSTTVSKTPGPSAAQSILGGAATGGALFGPWGAVGGGLLGAFS